MDNGVAVRLIFDDAGRLIRTEMLPRRYTQLVGSTDAPTAYRVQKPGESWTDYSPDKVIWVPDQARETGLPGVPLKTGFEEARKADDVITASANAQVDYSTCESVPTFSNLYLDTLWDALQERNQNRVERAEAEFNQILVASAKTKQAAWNAAYDVVGELRRSNADPDYVQSQSENFQKRVERI